MVEEPAFAFDAAAVAGERAVGADDAVTWKDDGDGIGSIGSADGTDGGRVADLLRQFAVREGSTAGDGPESAPDFALKLRAAGFYGQVIDGVEIPCEVAGDGVGEAVRIGGGLEMEFARSILIGEMTMDGVFVFCEEGEAQGADFVGDEHHLANGGREPVEEEVQGGSHWKLQSPVGLMLQGYEARYQEPMKRTAMAARVQKKSCTGRVETRGW
jgi:hypothetical protein